MRIRFALLIILPLFLFSNITEGKTVNLKWKPIEGASKYNLQVATDAEFSTHILAQTLKTNTLQTELKSGIYFLRVQGIGAQGKTGKWSEPFRLAVTAPIAAPPVTQAPHEVSYIAKTPQVESSWKSPEASAHYQVRVEKDGKEVLKQNTSEPKINFNAAEPGEYKVEVRSGIGNQYGPSVTVDRIVVEKKELVPPAWNMTQAKRFTSKKPVDLKWQAVPGADKYRLVIYKEVVNEDTGETVRVPVATQEVVENNSNLPALSPGHYVAGIESVSGETMATSPTEYKFDVKRAKPVEFEHVDVHFRLNMSPLTYRANLLEGGGAGSSFFSTAGSAEIAGTMWVPESKWGMQALGSWGGFTVQENSVTYNDLQAAAVYRYTFGSGSYKSELRPYLGARAWDVPLILANSGNSGGSSGGTNGNSVQLYDVTLFGPVIGLTYIKPFSDRLALTAMARVAVPLTNSTASGGVLAGFSALPTVNPKIEAGLKYALPGSVRLVGAVGYQQENMSWNTLTVNSNNGNTPYVPPSGSTSSVSIGETNFTVGIEVSDDGPLFKDVGDATRSAEHFSDFDVDVRYLYTPSSYNSKYSYDPQSSGSLAIQFAGTAELNTSGWFKNSHHGIRMLADWGGLTFNNSNISNLEFYAQWGYRPQTFKKSTGWAFKNFFGARSWHIPIITFDANNGVVDKSGAFNTTSPQLVGAAEDIQITKDLGSNWAAKLSLEGSAPLFFSDKASTVSTLNTTFNYKTELAAVRTLSEDLSAGLSLGYKSDSLQFNVPANTGSSTVTITSPIISIFGTYFF